MRTGIEIVNPCIDGFNLHVPISDKERKLNFIFFSDFFEVLQKVFLKALNAYVKSFEVPQRIVKIKI